MTFDEIMSALKQYENSDEYNKFVDGLFTQERVKAFLDTENGQKAMQPYIDRQSAKGLETWKTNNLQTLIDSEVKKRFPETDPKDVELANMKAQLGKIGKIYSEKEVSFVTGIISWDLQNVAKYLTGSEYEETAAGTRFYYGVDDRAPRVCLLFVSEDESEGKRITIVMPLAQFQGELEMDFNSDNPVSFNYAFDLMGTVNPEKQKSYFITLSRIMISTDTALPSLYPSGSNTLMMLSFTACLFPSI